MEKYKLVIFDFDDTLLHVNIDWASVQKEIIKAIESKGTVIPKKLKDADIMDMCNELALQGHEKTIYDIFRKREEQMINDGHYTVFPSMVALAKQLKEEGYLVAICSGNTPLTISKLLEKQGVVPDLIAARGTAVLNKPYPDLLNLILNKLNVKNTEAIFIGNNPDMDAVSGKRANIKTIVIRPNNEDDAKTLTDLLLSQKRFEHKALSLSEKTKIVFTAMSKHMFYFRRHAVKFVLENEATPISPYGIFDYFLNDSAERDLVRRANNNLLRISDELWVFGPVSDGVLAEIKQAKQMKKKIRYFKILESKDVFEIEKEDVEFEENLQKYSSEL